MKYVALLMLLAACSCAHGQRLAFLDSEGFAMPDNTLDRGGPLFACYWDKDVSQLQCMPWKEFVKLNREPDQRHTGTLEL